MRRNQPCLLPRKITCSLALGALLLPCSLAQTTPPRRGKSPEEVQNQLLSYYRQYPERYLRVEKHTWFLDANSKVSYHTFTLRSNAGVAYGDIEVTFDFQTGDGKSRGIRTVKVPGRIAPYQTLAVRRFAVKDSRQDCESVTATVARAAIYR